MRILKLEQLSSINQLNNTINDFKRNGRSFFTNYIPDRTLHEKWGPTKDRDFESTLQTVKQRYL